MVDVNVDDQFFGFSTEGKVMCDKNYKNVSKKVGDDKFGINKL